jgi:chromosome segregation ATPase
MVRAELSSAKGDLRTVEFECQQVESRLSSLRSEVARLASDLALRQNLYNDMAGDLCALRSQLETLSARLYQRRSASGRR